MYPLAQTFLISPKEFPNGLTLESVRLCFSSKDSLLPVTVQIRPTVNGYPSSIESYPFAECVLTPYSVKIPVDDIPSLDDSDKYTNFVLESPVYLKPGEHSIIVKSNSAKYELYSSTMGSDNLSDGQKISKKSTSGSLFKSQNASTWEPLQNTDLMFRLYRKKYSTSSSSQAKFIIKGSSPDLMQYDSLTLSTSEILVNGANLKYEFESLDSSQNYTSRKTIVPFQNYSCDDGTGRRLITANDSVIVTATMSTTDDAVSPLLDKTRFGIVSVKNLINNLPLANTGFVIENGGSGYTGSPTVTISGVGSGATATAQISSTGAISGITVTNGGSGYITSPTITISGTGSNAVVRYNGEDSISGGNAGVRYICRSVSLADGFESGDLRVYITAYKPADSNIHVFYKIISKSDTDNFSNKKWQLMTELGRGSFISSTKTDFRELVFAPGTNGIADNSVSYVYNNSLFTSFRKFAIKIVLSGSSTVDVPKVRDFRAIALPTGA